MAEGFNHLVEMDDFDVYSNYTDSILYPEVREWLESQGFEYHVDGCKLYFRDEAGCVAFRMRWARYQPTF